MYIYLSFVLFFTLMPIIVSIPFILNHPYTPMNLIPFVDILMGRGDFIRTFVIRSVTSEDLEPSTSGCNSSMPKLIKKQKNIVLLNFAVLLSVNGNKKPNGMVIMIFNAICLIKSPLPIKISTNGIKFIGV